MTIQQNAQKIIDIIGEIPIKETYEEDIRVLAMDIVKTCKESVIMPMLISEKDAPAESQGSLTL